MNFFEKVITLGGLTGDQVNELIRVNGAVNTTGNFNPRKTPELPGYILREIEERERGISAGMLKPAETQENNFIGDWGLGPLLECNPKLSKDDVYKKLNENFNLTELRLIQQGLKHGWTEENREFISRLQRLELIVPEKETSGETILHYPTRYSISK